MAGTSATGSGFDTSCTGGVPLSQDVTNRNDAYTNQTDRLLYRMFIVILPPELWISVIFGKPLPEQGKVGL